MKTRAPGKLILSGEHAVVHGAPALAMAVNRHATAEILPHSREEILLQLPEGREVHMPLSDLTEHLARVEARHQAFQAGTGGVSEIVPAPEDLLFAAVALCQPQTGHIIRLESNIPRGAGMGSSAAVILTILRGLSPESTMEILAKDALRCENFQHGRSSGLDVEVCLRGGMVYAKKGAFRNCSIPYPPAFQIWLSGTPESSTGECVAQVGKQFPKQDSTWNAFAAVTRRTRLALESKDSAAWLGLIRENHRLLCQIGVVPPAVQKVIAEQEAHGGAGKICGAGSIRGDAAGLILLIGPTLQSPPPEWTRLDLDLSPSGLCVCSPMDSSPTSP
ncbi:MAG: hypothetical protein JJU29_22225 [Verrucomicrobia bacterium]|nr:hypothetical protein [Verrucomicrobiota bacterium]MCH8514594.1 hypothetical protein [Kiritimatiellia bacterium]